MEFNHVTDFETKTYVEELISQQVEVAIDIKLSEPTTVGEQ